MQPLAARRQSGGRAMVMHNDSEAWAPHEARDDREVAARSHALAPGIQSWSRSHESMIRSLRMGMGHHPCSLLLKVGCGEERKIMMSRLIIIRVGRQQQPSPGKEDDLKSNSRDSKDEARSRWGIFNMPGRDP
jgi:hypothetical protein